MKNEQAFSPNDLHPCDYQYAITHKSVDNFHKDEMVFLKSNPEWLLKVLGVDHITNQVGVLTPDNNIETFPPQCILQYRYACMIIWRKKISINLN